MAEELKCPLLTRGRAAEHRLIAELLERGQHVAVPVVDNDGVDLVVNYRLRVQLKSSSPDKSSGFFYFGAGWGAKKVRTFRASQCDLFVFFGRPECWWIVPSVCIPHASSSMVVGNTRYPSRVSRSSFIYEWRDAWYLFDLSPAETEKIALKRLRALSIVPESTLDIQEALC